MSQGVGSLACRWAALLLVSMLSPRDAWSEGEHTTADPIAVGTRVRLLAPTAFQGPVQGTVVTLDDESLLIVDKHGYSPLRVSRQTITQLEVSAGRRGRPLEGALVGAGIGAALLAIYPREEYCADLEAGRTCPTKAGIIGIGVAGGALWGAVFGHLAKTDRWTPVPLDHAMVTLAPARGRGVRLFLAVGW